MKTTSRLALVAAAGLLAGFAITPASAADMGGNDLESRVAELEATTARKGNTKVSLTIYGQVNKGLLAWDDGGASDAYVVDNSFSSTRFGFKGAAKMLPGWKSGFNIEIELKDNASSAATQSYFTATPANSAQTSSTDGTLNLRQANWYIEGEKYGRVTVGLQNTATKDGVLVNLSNSMSDADNYFAKSFLIRGTDGVLTGTSWGKLAGAMDGMRAHMVRYDTPSLYGFILSAAWGENDFWDGAIRFAKEFGGVKIAAYAGYQWDSRGINNVTPMGDKTDNVERWTYGASVMHVGTGLYANIAGGTEEKARRSKDADYIYAQLGIERKIVPLGATTIYGEYGNYNDFAVSSGTFSASSITASEATRWGAGITQKIDSAAMDVYMQYHHYEADITQGTGATASKPALQDWDAVLTGARIKF